jgi:DNA-binding NarL/FixJ family response regulator
LSNKQIAYKLGLSEGTVKIHITLLMRALNVSNRVAAVRAGERAGLIEHSSED